MTIGVVFAAAFTISGAARDFSAQSGVPAVAFLKPDRPVAEIVSPIWHDEKERDDAGESSQLMRLLGIKSGMTVADIGAGSLPDVDLAAVAPKNRCFRCGSTKTAPSVGCKSFTPC